MAYHPKSVRTMILFLLVVSLFLKAKADNALIDGICKETQDFNFCTKSLYGDRRSSTASLNDLATITTAIALNQLRETSTRIPGIASGIKDPVGKERIGLCQSDYQFAILRFQEAFESASAESYYDLINQVTPGTNKIIECENIYRKENPISVCPLTADNHNLIKLNEIIFIIVGRLLQQLDRRS